MSPLPSPTPSPRKRGEGIETCLAKASRRPLDSYLLIVSRARPLAAPRSPHPHLSPHAGMSFLPSPTPSSRKRGEGIRKRVSRRLRAVLLIVRRARPLAAPRTPHPNPLPASGERGSENVSREGFAPSLIARRARPLAAPLNPLPETSPQAGRGDQKTCLAKASHVLLIARRARPLAAPLNPLPELSPQAGRGIDDVSREGFAPSSRFVPS